MMPPPVSEMGGGRKEESKIDKQRTDGRGAA